jgi:Arc/MetJ family transcription regulator
MAVRMGMGIWLSRPGPLQGLARIACSSNGFSGGCLGMKHQRGRRYDMGFRMKTTLNIDDTVMAELKREAARQGRTISELVETALRLLLSSQQKRGKIPALPKFRSGGELVDVANRDALYHTMEGR